MSVKTPSGDPQKTQHCCFLQLTHSTPTPTPVGKQMKEQITGKLYVYSSGDKRVSVAKSLEKCKQLRSDT